MTPYEEHMDFEAGAEDMEMYSMRQEAEREARNEAYYYYCDDMVEAGEEPLSMTEWLNKPRTVYQPPVVDNSDPDAPF